MSRTTADQKKPRGTEGLSASESLMLKSDAAKLRSDSHSRSLSPNHNTLQTLKSDGRMSSGFRAESPGPGSRSSSPKPKTLPANRSSPSGASSPRSSSPHDKNLPQKSTAPVKTKLDPPRERSKSDSYTLDPDRGPLVFAGPIFMNHREQALARLRSHPAQLKHKRDKHKGIWSSFSTRRDAFPTSSTYLSIASGKMHKPNSSTLLLSLLYSLRRKNMLKVYYLSMTVNLISLYFFC